MEFVAPAKVRSGDRVAVVSPSWAGPAVFPRIHEVGLRVLREQFDLVPIEFPTTRREGAAPEERAADLMTAFADRSISAVLATIGGDDQITVLPHLDPVVVRENPKPFLGYSDNTNMLNWLWNLGLVSYHGGSTMVHLARPGGPHPAHAASLRHALFSSATVEVTPVASFTDLEADWSLDDCLETVSDTTPDPGWAWYNHDGFVSGRTWGGNLEIIHSNLAVGRWIRPVAEYAGCILMLETSEDMPSSGEVSGMLRDMGERGLLSQFAGLLVAKPKAWDTHRQLTATERVSFRQDQYDAVLQIMGDYNPRAVVVCGLDFGHTDPQVVLPYGGLVTIDGPNRRLFATY